MPFRLILLPIRRSKPARISSGYVIGASAVSVMAFYPTPRKATEQNMSNGLQPAMRLLPQARTDYSTRT